MCFQSGNLTDATDQKLLQAYKDLGTVEELAALKERTRWIPVNERMPDKSGRCLTCDQEGNIHIFEHNPRSKHPFFIRPDDMRYYQPTHWMPLPEAPKEAQDER